MKATISLEDFSDLASHGSNGDHTTTSADSGSPSLQTTEGARRVAGQQATPEEDFRAILRLRETTPFVSPTPYHRSGINE